MLLDRMTIIPLRRALTASSWETDGAATAWFGVSTVYGEVRSVELAGRPKRIESTEAALESRRAILAT